MVKIAAIFDVDRTLIRTSTEKLFFLYLIRRQVLRPWTAVKFFGRQVCWWSRRFTDKSYLQELPVKLVQELARECYQRLIRPRLSPEGLRKIAEHRRAGHHLIILTGSLELLIRPLQEEVQAQELIATRLEVNHGRFTGAITGPHPRGVNKLMLVQEAARRLGVALEQSYAYADAAADLPLLQGVGRPVAVNPAWRLRCHARRRQWPVYSF